MSFPYNYKMNIPWHLSSRGKIVGPKNTKIIKFIYDYLIKLSSESINIFNVT